MGLLIRYRTFAAALACAATMLMVGAAAGVAASPPAVTGAATSVTSTDADLNGVINPGGLATFWEFQWGTTTAYGENTAPSGPISGTSSSSVMAPLHGLQPGTTYHFRLVAVQGAAGASGSPTLFGGADMTFQTPASGGGNPPGTNPPGSHAHASLLGRTFAVHFGHTQVGWRCSGTAGAECKGRFSISGRGRINGSLRTVRCGGGTFIGLTGRHYSVRTSLGLGCLSLLRRASHHRFGASLRATFSIGGGNLTTRVTFVLR
jgi:hypothetical protein